MKRILILTALILLISGSLIAGTLSMYVVEIDDLAEGSVVAKEFILLEGTADTFAADVPIAPGEDVKWEFSVKNHDGTTVSETAMDLDFKIEMKAAGDKAAIDPLKVTVKEGNDVLKTETGTGTITFTDEFALDDVGQEKTYTVEVEWPSDDTKDINFAGAGFGTAIEVSVTGTQK